MIVLFPLIFFLIGVGGIAHFLLRWNENYRRLKWHDQFIEAGFTVSKNFQGFVEQFRNLTPIQVMRIKPIEDWMLYFDDYRFQVSLIPKASPEKGIEVKFQLPDRIVEGLDLTISKRSLADKFLGI